MNKKNVFQQKIKLTNGATHAAIFRATLGSI